MFLGIDIGSSMTKFVLLNDDNSIANYEILPSHPDVRHLVEKGIAVLKKGQHTEIKKIVATGYGRKQLLIANEVIGEIKCLAAGGNYYFPQSHRIIDIGGQDTKVVNYDDKGRVKDFAMNDKCAAGTGRFIQALSESLDIKVSDLLKDVSTNEKLEINSICTVFAQSEVISLLSDGYTLEAIIDAVQRSIACRVLGLIKRVEMSHETNEATVFSGGVACGDGITKNLQKILGTNILRSEVPMICCAVGAALYAKKLS